MWHQVFLHSIRQHLLEEGFSRLRKCLEELEEEQIWYRPNENSNAVGNLVLHLCGNLHQWVVATLGQSEDIRQRAREFAERQPIPRQQLLDKLSELEEQIAPLLDRLEEEQLLKTYRVQIFKPSGMGILIHVSEHFSYHLGQISYITKMLKNKPLGYYDEEQL